MLDHAPQENGTLDYCAENGIGFISFSPLAQGLLTDRYLNGIPADSRMAKEHFLKHSALTPELLEQLKKWNAEAGERDETLAEMALAWLLPIRWLHLSAAISRQVPFRRVFRLFLLLLRSIS